MNEQELNKKFSEYEQKIIRLQEELSLIERGILDMSSVSTGLNDLKGKEGEEIMASIGRGIFVKAKLSSDDLLVDVGEGNFLKKSIEETKEIINSQKELLKKDQIELDKELSKINEEITILMKEFQQKQQI